MNKIISQYFIIIIGFILVVILYNSLVFIMHGDDVNWFIKQTVDLKYIYYRYKTWTSRCFIEIVLVYMCKNEIIFRILNIVITILLPFIICYIIDNKIELNHVSLMILLNMLYTFDAMTTAGVRATYINYYWPMFSFCFFILLFKNQIKKNINYITPIALCFEIFACNNELICLITIFVFLYIFFDIRKIRNKYIYIYFIAAFVELFVIALCPGNYARLESNITYWLPDFNSYSFIYKVAIAYLDTAKHYLFLFNYLSFVFYLLIIILLLLKDENKINILIGTIPLLLMFCAKYFVKEPIIDFSNASELRPYCFLFFSLLSLFIPIYNIFLIFKNNKNLFKIIIFVLFLGFASRIAMGFSPTIFASSTRTFLFLDFSIIISSYIIIVKSKLTNYIDRIYLFFTPCVLIYCDKTHIINYF